MADTDTAELQAQNARLERVVQNMQQRWGAQVAQYETQLAMLVAQLQEAEAAAQNASTDAS